MKKVVLGSLVAASVLMADPFVSYPGTKAKAMGGAFTAIANNNSAMYFNPAGLTNFDSDKEYGMFSLEIGSGVYFDPRDEDGDNGSDSIGNPQIYDNDLTYFLAMASQSGDGWNGGLALYTLYNLSDSDANNIDPTGAEQDMSVFSGSLSYALMQEMYPGGGKLSVGATLGMAFSGGGLMEMTSEDSSGSETSNMDDDRADGQGFFVAVGAKARLINAIQYKLDVGVNYRTRAEMEIDGSSTLQVKPIDLPEELAIGLAGHYLTEFGVITLALDHKKTGYKDATKDDPDNNDILVGMEDYTMNAIGFDFSHPIWQVRAGYFTSEADADMLGGTESMTGYSVGAGMLFDDGVWNIEFAYDDREYAFFNYAGKDKLSTYSVSLNYALGR